MHVVSHQPGTNLGTGSGEISSQLCLKQRQRGSGSETRGGRGSWRMVLQRGAGGPEGWHFLEKVPISGNEGAPSRGMGQARHIRGVQRECESRLDAGCMERLAVLCTSIPLCAIAPSCCAGPLIVASCCPSDLKLRDQTALGGTP